MDYLSKLEQQSIFIMREAFNKFENMAMLWSIGKDSTVLLWLARKAFFGHVPFPLLHWTELNVLEYIDRENIPIIPLYFANGKGERYRSLGCAPCTGSIKSKAKNVKEIIEELRGSLSKTPERSGRAQDKESEDAFEKLRRDGYM